jgi:maltose-binding protein MalE
MKKIFFIVITACFVSIAQAQTSPAEQLAEKVAQKMKDSLSLSSSQKQQLYNINMQLHSNKLVVRQQYAGSDSLVIKVQIVENTRDSLYRPVLTQQQYDLYRQKKKTLVSNN